MNKELKRLEERYLEERYLEERYKDAYIILLRELLREAYGFTTADGGLLPERIKTALDMQFPRADVLFHVLGRDLED